MKKILIIFVVIVCFYSCKKEKKNQFSYWTVDGVEYASNDVELSIGKVIAMLGSGDPHNWFDLTFYGNYPKNNSIKLTRSNDNMNPTIAELSFFINNKYYGIDSDTTYLEIKKIGNKYKYILPKSWYSHYENGVKDSVQIEATLSEP